MPQGVKVPESAKIYLLQVLSYDFTIGTMEDKLRESYEKLQAVIAESAHKNGQNVAVPRLIAVSKGQSVAAIEATLSFGQHLFGENRVQEAQRKFGPLRAAYKDIELHLIGPLQTNKVKAALVLFDVIQTIDRAELVMALAAQRARLPAADLRTNRFYVQVNIGVERQKAGVLPRALPELLALCAAQHVPISGLMCIPPQGQDPAPYFGELAALARQHGLAELSMGMSGDYGAAIAAGATYIRVGTALFGARPAVQPLEGTSH